MTTWKLLAIKHANARTLRVLYVVLALLAMALAGGAPMSYGGS